MSPEELEELKAMGIEAPEDLERQQAFIKTWNELGRARFRERPAKGARR